MRGGRCKAKKLCIIFWNCGLHKKGKARQGFKYVAQVSGNYGHTQAHTHTHTLRRTSILCAYSVRGRAYFGPSCKLDKPMVDSAVNLADKLSSGSQ